jgi:GT2 family glycosyltransferase
MWPLLEQCLESVYNTDWPDDKIEIIVVDNGSTEENCIEGLKDAHNSHKIIVIRDNGDFNFARLNNEAVRISRGELLVLLNNDTQAITKEWLKELAAYALLPGAGAVGPKLLYEDSTVQHAGVISGGKGGVEHCHRGIGANEGGYRDLANITHEVLAVTGACLAVSKRAYNEVGGLKELFKAGFNDIVFCMDLYKKGYTNYYVAEPLFYHYESKSRGFDDTVSKADLARIESMRAWNLHKDLLHNDPYYSPCLSLEKDYALSFAPRRHPAWRRYIENRPVHILILSSVHRQGRGVSLVIQQHAKGLVARGFRVTIGGPTSKNDREYPRCERIEVLDPRLAFSWAIKNSVDAIIAQTPPFFAVARWAGAAMPVIAYDHGEPPPGLFNDWAERLRVLKEKDRCLMMCSKVFAISKAVAEESRTPVDGVIPLGNDHLGQWDNAKIEIREINRQINGWSNSFVILNVCRFDPSERNTKGVDCYINIANHLKDVSSKLAKNAIFVLCGDGDESAVKELRRLGIDVRDNVSDDEMIGYYAAADAYLSFSTWEGYNLGIGQALAMGLPVIASDIPAHRAFGVTIANNLDSAVASLMELMSNPLGPRIPRLWDWDCSIGALTAAINNSLHPDQPTQAFSDGAPGTQSAAAR